MPRAPRGSGSSQRPRAGARAPRENLRSRSTEAPPRTLAVRHWLLDPGSIYRATQLPDLSVQRRLVARAAEIGKSWSEVPGTRQRAVLTALIGRIDVGADQIDMHFRPARLGALLDEFSVEPVRPDQQLDQPRIGLGGRKWVGAIDPHRDHPPGTSQPYRHGQDLGFVVARAGQWRSDIADRTAPGIAGPSDSRGLPALPRR